ncbi:hypothetical protein SEA_PUPPER_199 [Gordonia phage Pupper]|uniref:Uncharacterized protein n=1 Tax=Gordonia phage Pupper TaxID=2571249 RepID=A0A4Y6EKW8_9CAUD|nr:hypothetical protein KHQ83_gp078 [Gordonia phage Pupper]QDF18685.1 hypothetical protein SEA_PUPPER_199 [Gordonia phage Pupper]QDF18917.1 hypothetical protein SEA_SCENTAE_198 [Gordonia phage SCentae]
MSAEDRIEQWKALDREIALQEGRPAAIADLEAEKRNVALRHYPGVLEELEKAREALRQLDDAAHDTDYDCTEYSRGKDYMRDYVKSVIRDHGFYF